MTITSKGAFARREHNKVEWITLDDRKLFVSTPLAKTGRYGDHLIHEGEHISFWAELLKCRDVPHREYEEFLDFLRARLTRP
jgi:hypothetical protein